MLTRKASAVVAEGGNQDTARLTTGSQGLRAIGGGNPIPIALLDRRATRCRECRPVPQPGCVQRFTLTSVVRCLVLLRCW